MKRLVLMFVGLVIAFAVGVTAGQDSKSIKVRAAELLFRSSGYSQKESKLYAKLPRNDMALVFDFTTKKIKRGSRLIIQDYNNETVGMITFNGGVSYTQLIPKPKESGK